MMMMITLPLLVIDLLFGNHYYMRYSMEQLLLVFLCIMMVRLRVCHFMPGNLLIINNNNYYYF